jgi:hypothetical protein
MSREYGERPGRETVDTNFLISKPRSSENHLSSVSGEVDRESGMLRLYRAYEGKLPGATADEIHAAAEVTLKGLAKDIEEGWTPGAVKQHGRGFRFRARDITIEDDDSSSWGAGS